MVRLIPVERGGRIVWIEEAPDRCPDGHEQLAPSTGGCPQCHEPVRKWTCRASGCEQVLIDDEHVHGSRR